VLCKINAGRERKLAPTADVSESTVASFGVKSHFTGSSQLV